MKGFKSSVEVLGVAAVGCLMTATNVNADQCAFISPKQAEKAFEVLTKRKTIVDFCEPCGDKIPGAPYTVNTVEVNPQDEFREILVNGKSIDLAYTFVRTSANTYENIALLVGCPASDVSRTITVDDKATSAFATQEARITAEEAAANQAAEAARISAETQAAFMAAQAALSAAFAANEKATDLDADGYYNRGMSHYNQKNYDKAIADFSDAIKLHPKAAEYYRWRGFAYDELAQYDKTIADYTEVIRLEPKLAMNYFNRGLAYNKKEDFSSAVSDFTKALKLTPDDADYLFNRAIAYGNNGEYELAIADMEIAKTKFPQEFNAPDSLLTVYREALATPHKRGRPVVAYAAAKKSALSYEYEASGQRSGTVYFYREGNKINDGVLRVFDSHKNLVKRVTVSDRGQGGQNKRNVGSWDITNLHGKPVRPGTYSVSGTVSTRDGRNEEVSLTVELR